MRKLGLQDGIATESIEPGAPKEDISLAIHEPEEHSNAEIAAA